MNIRELIANKEWFTPRLGYNPHRVRAWIIGHEFGVLAIAYASHEQEALDFAVDAGLMDCMQLSDEDSQEAYDTGTDGAYISAGNAGELFYQDYLWIKEH
jgi:hypothetical protein